MEENKIQYVCTASVSHLYHISAYTFSGIIWISQLESTKSVWILGFIYMGLSIEITVYLSSFCLSLHAHTLMAKWIAEIYEQKYHENWNGLCNKLLTG